MTRFQDGRHLNTKSSVLQSFHTSHSDSSMVTICTMFSVSSNNILTPRWRQLMTSSINWSNADRNGYHRLLVQVATNVKDHQPGFVCMITVFDSFCFISSCIFVIRLTPPWYPCEISDFQDDPRQITVLYKSV